MQRVMQTFREKEVQILPFTAMYEVSQKQGRSKPEAYKVVSGEMWKFLNPSGMHKLAKKRLFLPLVKKSVPFGIKKGAGTGWRYTWHQDDPMDEFPMQWSIEERNCV